MLPLLQSTLIETLWQFAIRILRGTSFQHDLFYILFALLDGIL